MNCSNNTIKGNTVSLSGHCGINLYNSSSNKVINNRFSNNGVIGLDKPGISLAGSSYNEISSNIISLNPFGISVGENSIGNRINQNNIEGNTRGGIDNHDPTEIDATNNWWGDPSGPWNPRLNPTGKGNEVSDNVLFKPWLNAPISRE